MKKISTFVAFVTFLFSMAAVSAVSGQADVGRRTTAATYPLDESVTVRFRGTTRFPRMSGEARIKRTKRNGTEIDLNVSKMPRPFELGAGYATYVLWAISPDGQVDNLGEIKRRGFFEFDSKISVTTPLQTFALIVTAEPHFLVTRPSQAIMLENLTPYNEKGIPLNTTTAVTYFGNSSDYFRDPRTPEIAELDYSKTPSTILQAKQAVALAKFAGAERDAPTELEEANVLLKNADLAWQAGRKEELVDIDARKAISAAVKAENTATVRKAAREKRNEQAQLDADTRKAEEQFSNAQNQIDELKGELERETRNRELAERDAMNYSSQLKDLKAENGRLREELGRMKLDAENLKTKVQTAETELDKQTRLAKAKAAEGDLMKELKQFGSVSKVDNSIVLVLPESLWTGSRTSTLTMLADGKMASLGEILANNPDYAITIESHTDGAAPADVAQSLTDSRANLVAEKFKFLGVPESRIRAKGFGGQIPAVPNTTARNRAKNRRVNVILDLTL